MTSMLRMTPSLVLVLAALAAAGCKFPYPADVVGEDAGACVASTTTCADATLTVCDADGHPTATACAFGCAPGGEARCADLAPSNGLAMYLDQARTAAPVLLTGAAVIDTDTGQVRVGGNLVGVQTAVVAGAPVDILVIIARSFEAGDVTTRGRRALAIVADGDVVLHGTLSVSAVREVPGAGAGAANDPACTARKGTTAIAGSGGAGGGGFGTAGGSGGDGGPSQGGAAGASVGNVELTPLRGGCPGANPLAVPSSNPIDRQPGAAGGALQISARGALRMADGAQIAASGGGAKGNTAGGPIPPTCMEQAGQPLTCEMGAGGGAGGAILVEASGAVIASSAALVANGGAGHCGYLGFSPDGRVSEGAAQGADCGPGGTTGSGGSGGAKTSGGFNGGAGLSYGGGGGGGAGRIRFNLPSGTTFDVEQATISPSPSLGEATRR